jgi:hypothetical protein
MGGDNVTVDLDSALRRANKLLEEKNLLKNKRYEHSVRPAVSLIRVLGHCSV